MDNLDAFLTEVERITPQGEEEDKTVWAPYNENLIEGKLAKRIEFDTQIGHRE